MQAARGAVKDLREKGKSFVKPKYADQLLGSGLEEQIRRATAKTLPGPDLASNRRVGPSLFSATTGPSGSSAGLAADVDLCYRLWSPSTQT